MHRRLRHPSTLLPISAAAGERRNADARARSRSRRRSRGWLAIPLALWVGACGSSNPATPPLEATATAPATATASVAVASESASPSPSAPASVPPASSPPVAASPRSQTSTAWGRIWDTIPASFPVYPGAKPGQAPAGPASASLVASSADVETVSAWYKAELDRSGYATVVQPALEDGSRVLDSSGKPAGCKVQTRIAKQGDETMIGILYGAICPIR